MRYALLAYRNVEVRDGRTEEEQRRINAGVAEVLARPNVTGWLRLQDFDRRVRCARMSCWLP